MWWTRYWAMLSWLVMLDVISIVRTGDAPCDTECQWTSWDSWSQCTKTCGGGLRYRTKSLCCKVTVESFEACVAGCGLNIDDGSQIVSCNENCLNGGLYQDKLGCSCTDSYTGPCCTDKITCGHPGYITNGQVLGYNYDYAAVVTYVCNTHYNLTGNSGSNTRKCNRFLNTGIWSGSQPSCVFVNTCGSNPCQNGGTCIDGLAQYTCQCVHGWSGTNCEIDVLPPAMDNCPADFSVNNSARQVNVSWERPEFRDDHGYPVHVTSNYEPNVQLFYWDEYTVQYVASKPSNGLQTVCEVDIGVYPHPCQTALQSISHGAIACNGWNSRFTTVCAVLCESNKDVPAPHDVTQLYVCGGTGHWTPSPAFTGCTEERSGMDQANPAAETAQHYYTGLCTDPSTTTAIQQQYLSILNGSDFRSLCTEWQDCAADRVTITC